LAELTLSDMLPLPDLTEVFSLLDPNTTGIANFYIYDSYDIRLAPLRRELKALQEHDGDPQRISQLLAEQNDIQQEVCVRLSDNLRNHHSALTTAMEQMAYIDFLLAKADLATRWNLCRPQICDRLHFQNLINPRLRDRNLQANLRYQPVSIDISNGVTLITGANMAGKTVLLKSVGTAQTMIQCGFYAPAETADTMIFNDVASSIGDEQNQMNGLSSYASEIIKISNILQRSRNERLLILIDEPARTTNPVEGKALVQAIITILEQEPSVSLITTHYGQLGSTCRRLRVRGFVEDMADVPLTPQNISRFIDYSLTDDQADDVPHEALRIADILGCDSRMIDLARHNING
jgi:DNA mismatch repair ATPase MutS